MVYVLSIPWKSMKVQRKTIQSPLSLSQRSKSVNSLTSSIQNPKLAALLKKNSTRQYTIAEPNVDSDIPMEEDTNDPFESAGNILVAVRFVSHSNDSLLTNVEFDRKVQEKRV